MPSRTEDRSGRTGKLSSAAALLLCVIHILTVLGMAHQERLSMAEALSGNWKFLFVNYGLWLSPIVVVLLSMRNPILVGICAVPISIMFAGRLYYVWKFHAYGINVIPKLGDWAWFLATLVGALSIAILAVWLPIRIARYLGRLVRARK
jgi:hypothetical protein